MQIISKNAVLTRFNSKLTLKKLNLPKPRFGEVLVKIKYSGVCKSQLMEIKGYRNTKKWLPHLLGHEGSGKVVDVGSGVKKVKKNDEVILTWIKSKGINCNGGKIKNSNQLINFGPITTFGEYSLISENRIIKKPTYIDSKIAALFGCALPTGFGMVLNETKLKKKDKILIFGVGGIGYSAIIMALSMGLKNITVLEKNKFKLKIAKKLPVKKIFNVNNKKNYNKFKKENLGYFDVCYETTGTTKAIVEGLNLIKDNGKLIFASHPKNNEKLKIDPYELIKGKKILGSWGGKTNPEKDIQRYFKLIKPQLKNLSLLTNKIYKLNKINQAIKDLSNGKCLRPLIKM